MNMSKSNNEKFLVYNNENAYLEKDFHRHLNKCDLLIKIAQNKKKLLKTNFLFFTMYFCLQRKNSKFLPYNFNPAGR